MNLLRTSRTEILAVVSDPSMAAGMQSNEIWLSLTTDDTGGGTQMVSITTHLARPEAASIVVHDNDMAGTRLACIDLK
jgi:hypothetical protein